MLGLHFAVSTALSKPILDVHFNFLAMCQKTQQVYTALDVMHMKLLSCTSEQASDSFWLTVAC